MKVVSLIRKTLLFAASLCLAGSVHAQGTGSISGRVLNPATQEYIRNAEVRVEGTNIAATTETGGYYTLFNVPAGPTTIVAAYPGANSVTSTVTVAPGATATHDFELSLVTAQRNASDAVQLGAFIVETEREGQSKMVAEQKQAINIKQVMSTDNFGDMSEQNIGEFLKYLPGITIDYVETDTRSASMSGMDPKYGYVTLDGNAQASGDSGSFGGSSRQFEFESISMNNIESIEVNKTLTADMWADAPAGTVNLRTRSALDSKRQKFGFSTGLLWNSLENGFRKTPRHDDDTHAKTRPRLDFNYTSGAILGGKLGITLNGSFTNIYKEQFRESLSFDYSSTFARAAGKPLLTAINYKDGPKISEKSSGGFKVDYQPFPGLRMTTAVSYTYFNDFFANRNLNFITGAANLGAGSSFTRVVANNANNTTTRIDQSGETTGKLKDNTNLSYMVNYKNGPWTVDLTTQYSRARQSRGGLFFGTIGNTPVRLSRIGFIAERSDVEATDWHFTQTSGGDWYDYKNWGVFDAQDLNSNQERGKTEQYSAKIDVKRVMSWSIPTSYKFGVARNVAFKNRSVYDSFVGRYVGPTNNALTNPLPQSKAYFDIDTGFGGGIGPLPVPDKEALYALRRDHPEYFTQSEANLATQITSLRGSPQSNQEDVQAAYVLQESRLGKLQINAGVRMENTRTISTVMNRVPLSENPFATRNATTGVLQAANTRNYAAYEYSRGNVTKWGEYRDWMPSAAAKYPLSKDLFLKVGYNKAIKRPDLNRTAGQLDIDVDDVTGNATVTVPNPNLKPERSERFSAMLEYYFGAAGTASIHLFQTEIKGAVDENAEGISAEEAGFGNDPIYDNYRFRTYFNLAQKRRIRGIELSYSQQLTFFRNEWLRTTTIWGNYSQFNATPRPRTGTKFFPRNASGGIKWNTPNRKFSLAVQGTWTDETFTGGDSIPLTSVITPGEQNYFRPRTILGINLGYKLTKQLSLFVSGDRAYDSGKIWYYKSDGRFRQIENYGSQWSVGIKGEF